MLQNLLPALIGALVGGLITVIGWLANYYFGRKMDIETRQREAKLRYLQLQIEELYAPLWSLSEQSKTIHSLVGKWLALSNGDVRDVAKSEEQISQMYKFFREAYYLPINSEVAEIIRKKVYLLKDGVMPVSFSNFIKHQITSEALSRLSREKNIGSTHMPWVDYPVQFNVDVKSTLDELRKQYLFEISMLEKPKKNKRNG